MTTYVSKRRANARLRRRADPTLDPLVNSGTRLPKYPWVGGRIDITAASIDFRGSDSVETRPGRHKSIPYQFTVPLDRISATAVRHGIIGVRYLTIDIDDGSQLQLRPTKLDDTYAQLRAAIRSTSDEDAQ